MSFPRKFYSWIEKNPEIVELYVFRNRRKVVGHKINKFSRLFIRLNHINQRLFDKYFKVVGRVATRKCPPYLNAACFTAASWDYSNPSQVAEEDYKGMFKTQIYSKHSKSSVTQSVFLRGNLDQKPNAEKHDGNFLYPFLKWLVYL